MTIYTIEDWERRRRQTPTQQHGYTAVCPTCHKTAHNLGGILNCPDETHEMTSEQIRHVLGLDGTVAETWSQVRGGPATGLMG